MFNTELSLLFTLENSRKSLEVFCPSSKHDVHITLLLTTVCYKNYLQSLNVFRFADKKKDQRHQFSSQDKSVTSGSNMNGAASSNNSTMTSNYQNYQQTGYGGYNQPYTQGYGGPHYQGWGYPAQQGGYGYNQQGWGGYANYYGQR